VILLWGTRRDAPLAAVLAALEHRKAEVALVDQDAAEPVEVCLQVDARVSGTLRLDGRLIDLDAITAAYLRPTGPSPRRTPGDGDGWAARAALERVLLTWADLTAAALVVNRPAAMAANSSKPYQAQLIRSLGWHTPRTLITTDPARLRAHATRRRLVYKSISAQRSIVAQLDPDDTARLEDVAGALTQFQEHIAGADVRVHVVGDAVFATEIACSADDYRYAHRFGEQACLRPIALPHDVERRCRSTAHAMGLHVAGIDLRRTARDEWVCFEVNPSPGFTYYEDDTEQPIAHTIATQLAATSTPSPRRAARSDPHTSRRPAIDDRQPDARRS
jgi:RimK-like ATP-grasp domain